MLTIYFGQTGAPLEVDTGIDLSSVSEYKLKFRHFDGTEGEFTGDSLTVDGTIIKYKFSASSWTDKLTKLGTYAIWSHVTLESGETIPGTPYEIVIVEEGTL